MILTSDCDFNIHQLSTRLPATSDSQREHSPDAVGRLRVVHHCPVRGQPPKLGIGGGDRSHWTGHTSEPDLDVGVVGYVQLRVAAKEERYAERVVETGGVCGSLRQPNEGRG